MSKLSPEKFKKRLWACKYCGSHIPNTGYNDWMMNTGNSRVCDREECKTIQSIGERPTEKFNVRTALFRGPKIHVPLTREEAEEQNKNIEKYQKILDRKQKKYGNKAFIRNG